MHDPKASTACVGYRGVDTVALHFREILRLRREFGLSLWTNDRTYRA